MTPAAALSVQSLTVRTAGGAPLVSDVDFAVSAGETLAIVGESGSGKSLTTRAVVGLLPPGLTSEGRIVVRGADVAAPDLGTGDGLRVSLLMQDPFTMLNPLQTVFAHIAEGLPSEVRRDRATLREEVRRRLREVGLDADTHARRYPFQLSGGIRQRVALAAALTRDPHVLIADEPTTALDARTQGEVLDMIRRLQRERDMGVVLVTHDLGLAFSTAERILVMYAGRVLEQGPARRLRVQPEHPYTHGLLQSRLPSAYRADRLVSIPGRVPSASSVEQLCAFADRCAWAGDECRAARPALREVASHHLSACIRIAQIRPELSAVPAAGRAMPPEAAPATAPALLTVHRLTKHYGRRGSRGTTAPPALDGVSFDVRPGESVGLVGESGSGKTTIARCLLGLTEPDGGTIRLDGLDVSRYRRLRAASLRRTATLVQIVFQDPYSSLNPSRTIGAALAEALSVRRARDTAHETAALLELVGLPSSYARLRPAQLSGGERQRVAIARALALRPRLLVCDEPVASLDVSVQAETLEVLRSAAAEHDIAMLFITHDLAVARQMTQRLLVLYRGGLVEEGATDAVLDDPRHPYTQELVRSAAEHDRSVGVLSAPADSEETAP